MTVEYNDPDEQQGQLVQPEMALQEKSSTQEAYTWSTTRVVEGIAINVCSAVILAALTLITTVTPAVILLYVQNNIQFLVIPTYWLRLFVFVGLGILLTLLLVGSLLFSSRSWIYTIVRGWSDDVPATVPDSNPAPGYGPTPYSGPLP